MGLRERFGGLDEPGDPITGVYNYYQRMHKPLPGIAVFHLLEPLAGTSFFDLAKESLEEEIRQRRKGGENLDLYAQDVFSLFWGEKINAKFDTFLDYRYLDFINSRLFLPAVPMLEIGRVLIHSALREQDMMLLEGRTDDIFTTPPNEHRAYTLAASQLSFYTNGALIHTLPIGRLYTLPFSGMYNHIPEGFLPTEDFMDKTKLIYPAIPKECQAVTSTGRRALYISREMGERVTRRK